MSEKKVKTYTAEFKESAVKLAVESDQPATDTARDLGVNANTLRNWISKYHRPKASGKAEKQEKVSEISVHQRPSGKLQYKSHVPGYVGILHRLL